MAPSTPGLKPWTEEMRTALDQLHQPPSQLIEQQIADIFNHAFAADLAARGFPNGRSLQTIRDDYAQRFKPSRGSMYRTNICSDAGITPQEQLRRNVLRAGVAQQVNNSLQVLNIPGRVMAATSAVTAAAAVAAVVPAATSTATATAPNAAVSSMTNAPTSSVANPAASSAANPTDASVDGEDVEVLDNDDDFFSFDDEDDLDISDDEGISPAPASPAAAEIAATASSAAAAATDAMTAIAPTSVQQPGIGWGPRDFINTLNRLRIGQSNNVTDAAAPEVAQADLQSTMAAQFPNAEGLRGQEAEAYVTPQPPLNPPTHPTGRLVPLANGDQAWLPEYVEDAPENVGMYWPQAFQ